MPVRGLKCIVTGRVQGVFFRASTAEKAEQLGLRGSVRNLSSGDVEVIVVGADAAVDALVAWLWQGPPAAEVVSVSIEAWDSDTGSSFEVAR